LFWAKHFLHLQLSSLWQAFQGYLVEQVPVKWFWWPQVIGIEKREWLGD